MRSPIPLTFVHCLFPTCNQLKAPAVRCNFEWNRDFVVTPGCGAYRNGRVAPSLRKQGRFVCTVAFSQSRRWNLRVNRAHQRIDPRHTSGAFIELLMSVRIDFHDQEIAQRRGFDIGRQAFNVLEVLNHAFLNSFNPRALQFRSRKQKAPAVSCLRAISRKHRPCVAISRGSGTFSSHFLRRLQKRY